MQQSEKEKTITDTEHMNQNDYEQIIIWTQTKTALQTV